MDKRPDDEALRSLVREALRELIPAAVARARQAADPAVATSHGLRPGIAETRFEEVTIADDAQLSAFVQRLIGLFDDPSAREAIRTGHHGFRLARGGVGDGGTARNSNDPKEPLEKGVLSESRVISLARAGRKIVIGKGVVVTPLAKDKARQLGVKLERKR